ncbi:MAG: hypothetical protein KC561_01650, partial [Myxococcales bacterium]|nr:hypothetical protein [Myxococcales bacterium]
SSVTTEATDVGVLIQATVDYYVPLANNFFLKPGIGAGYFVGTRSRDLEGDLVQETKLSGFAGVLEVGLVYYLGEDWSLRGGANLILRTVTETSSEDQDAATADETNDPFVLTLDAGFNLGIGYAF